MMSYRIALFISISTFLTTAFTDIALSKSETIFIYHPLAETGELLGDERWGLDRAACEAACSSDAACRGYQGADLGSDGTVETSACKLLISFKDGPLAAGDTDGMVPGDGVWVKTDIDLAAESARRRAELSHLSPDLVAMADEMRGKLPASVAGETFESLFDAPYPQGVDTMFEHGDVEGEMGAAWVNDAFAKLRQALAAATSHADWLAAGRSLVAYAPYLTEFGRADQKQTILAMFDLSVPTAANAYLLARDAYERSSSLELLAAALFLSGDAAGAEKALAAREEIWPDGRMGSILADLAGSEDSPALRRSDAENIE